MKDIKFLRREIGLSQISLAAAGKIPKYKIQLAESGVPILKEDEVKRIAKILSIPFEIAREEWAAIIEPTEVDEELVTRKTWQQ